MKVLLTEFGSYNNLPLEISSKILEIEELNMNEQNRKKYKPIGHLAKASEFKFIEIDLSNIVSYESYEKFEKQIRSREKVRLKKIEQENRYNDKAKLIQERKYEHFLRTNLVVNTNRKSRLVPEWNTNNPDETTWFTLDGQEIKSESKKAWEGEDEEIKEHPNEPNKENEDANQDSNLWSDLDIPNNQTSNTEFPALGEVASKSKPEKVPVIISKRAKRKGKKNQNRKKTLTYTNDKGETHVMDLSDSESQFLDTGDCSMFHINAAIQETPAKRMNKKKRKKR